MTASGPSPVTHPTMPALRYECVGTARRGAYTHNERLLGGAVVGAAADVAPDVALDRADVPLQRLAAPALDAQPSVALWLSDLPCRHAARDGIRYGSDGRVLYGVVEVDEALFGDDKLPLGHATRDAYRRIFALLDREGCPYLWRTWNYLADINREAQGLERYRQFNIGRHDAFAARAGFTAANMPAACALGVAAGPLSIAFVAGKTAPLAIENPRQVAAYDYPPDYGPRSPSFARATLAQLPGQELLFVSGTASIVGHATVHVGDIAAQVRESLANIMAVVAEANRQSPHRAVAPWREEALVHRAYVRHAGDYGVARDTLRDVLGDADVTYVQADICRADLLVEVEAFATRQT